MYDNLSEASSVRRREFYVINGTNQFSWRNFRDDSLDRAAIVKPLEVDKE